MCSDCCEFILQKIISNSFRDPVGPYGQLKIGKVLLLKHSGTKMEAHSAPKAIIHYTINIKSKI